MPVCSSDTTLRTTLLLPNNHRFSFLMLYLFHISFIVSVRELTFCWMLGIFSLTAARPSFISVLTIVRPSFIQQILFHFSQERTQCLIHCSNYPQNCVMYMHKTLVIKLCYSPSHWEAPVSKREKANAVTTTNWKTPHCYTLQVEYFSRFHVQPGMIVPALLAAYPWLNYSDWKVRWSTNNWVILFG